MFARLGTLIATLLALTALATGCCPASGLEEVGLALVPSEVEAEPDVVVLAEFEEAVFFDGRVDVYEVRASFEDATGTPIGWFSEIASPGGRIGETSDTYAEGVIVGGGVVDARSLELRLALDEPLDGGEFRVRVIADDGNVECSAADSGTATLRLSRVAR
ncbi:MAG: hypothetical protein AAF500_21615 [Myxococcota bacterium]